MMPTMKQQQQQQQEPVASGRQCPAFRPSDLRTLVYDAVRRACAGVTNIIPRRARLSRSSIGQQSRDVGATRYFMQTAECAVADPNSLTAMRKVQRLKRVHNIVGSFFIEITPLRRDGPVIHAYTLGSSPSHATL